MTAVGIVAIAVILARLAGVFVLTFGALLVAAALQALARPLVRHTPLGGRAAVAAVLVVLIGMIAAGSYVFGERLADQVASLSSALPHSLNRLRELAENTRFAGIVDRGLDEIASGIGSYATSAATIAASTVDIALELLLLLFIAIYVALDPQLYLRGTLALFPPGRRPAVKDALEHATADLHRWLKGQLVQMTFVALLTTAGLWLLGVPLAVSLGVLTGLIDFVPFVGPVAAGVIASLVALTEAPSLALYTVLLYVAVQQVEGHVLVPLVQKWAVSLAPALALVSVLVFGTLFGMPGILVATLLAVVIVSLVASLYVDRALGDNRHPGAG